MRNISRFAGSRSSARRRFVLGGGALFATTGLLRFPAGAAQYEFKGASNLTPDHPISIRLNQMWAQIEQESGGRMHTRFFPNSELGGDTAMFSQLRVGAINFFLCSAGNLANVIPVSNICYLGFAFKDADDGIRVMSGKLGDYVRRQSADKGMYLFRDMWDGGMYHIGSSPHPIHNPDDFRGFKLRVTESRIFVDLFKGLGATPTTISLNEVYTALQTKLIDGEAAPFLTIETAKFYEVNKYISLTNHAWAGLWLMANGDTWKSLPPDLQVICERNHAKFSLLGRRDTKLGINAVAEKLASQGMIFNDVDPAPFRSHLRPYYDYWHNEFGSTAWDLLLSSLNLKSL